MSEAAVIMGDKETEMREILFRGKHIHLLPQNEHLDGTWVEGYLCDENYIYSPGLKEEFLIDPQTVCQYTGLNDNTKWEQLSEREKNKFLSEWNYKKEHRNIKEDWNGRKIFEGDIIEFEDTGEEGYEYKDAFDFSNRAKVVWNKGHFELDCFLSNNSEVLDRMNSSPDEFYDMFGDYAKVIGNIFDNADLIGGQE